MRFSNTRRWLPALATTALLHVLVIFVLLHAITIEPAARAKASARETQITLLPVLAPPDRKRSNRRRAAGGSNAITTYFNPDAVPLFVPQAKLTGLQTALSACAPESYDMASDQIRRICGRIGALLQSDPRHFGVTQDVTDASHWQHELIRRNSPVLAPCMSANGPDLLYTLLCVYHNLFVEWEPEKHTRYEE